MRRLICLTETDAGIEPSSRERADTRHAARAVLFDHSSRIALLYVASDNYYKLPGGGVEPGETLEEALRREVLEETGCTIDVLGEVGMIEEHRNAWGITQYSYCYLARVTGPCAEPCFTDHEIEDGFSLDWATPDEAIALIRDSVPQSYHGRFIQVRDRILLEEALDTLEQHQQLKGLRA